MKVSISHPVYGEIIYNESIWTGKKSITVNGVAAQRKSKKIFLIADKDAVISGDYFRGVSLLVAGEVIELSPKAKWYEIMLSILPLIFLLTWGNSPSLCAIFPVIGGAIGGALGGVAIIVSLLQMKKAQTPVAKIFIGIGIFIVTILIAYALAIAYIMLLINSLYGA